MKLRRLALFLILLLFPTLLLSAPNVGESGDSTKVEPVVPSAVETPSTTTSFPQIVNEQYPAACPETISNCPDINHPDDNPKTCPKLCSVTQSSSVSKTINPACPNGYTQVTEYNSIPEEEWNPNPGTVWPTTLNEYYTYVNQGDNCSVRGGTGEWTDDTCTKVHGPKWHFGDIIDGMPTAPDTVVEIINTKQNCWDDGSQCSIPSGCDGYDEAYTYSYWYQQLGCALQPGNDPVEGMYLPGSVVCARMTSTWTPISSPNP